MTRVKGGESQSARRLHSVILRSDTTGRQQKNITACSTILGSHKERFPGKHLRIGAHMSRQSIILSSLPRYWARRRTSFSARLSIMHISTPETATSATDTQSVALRSTPEQVRVAKTFRI